MSFTRIHILMCLAVFSFAASGCAILPGSSGRDGESARAAGPGGAGEVRDDFSGLSPEVSMQRDLLQLREREAGQREAVENMRLALNQGQEDMEREESRLRDIQMQIERYDSAMRRYEASERFASAPTGGMAGGARQRSATAQPRYSGEERYQDSLYQAEPYPRGDRYASAGRDGSRGGYDAYSGSSAYPDVQPSRGQAGRGGAGLRSGGMTETAGGAPGREEVLYAGAYHPGLEATAAPVGDLSMRRAASAGPVRQAPRFEDDAADAKLFSSPEVAAASAPRRSPPARPAEAFSPRQGNPFPAGGMATPGIGAGENEFASRRVQEREREAPAVPVAPAAPEEDGFDEVFTPDLFLSRR